jgi:nucleoside-diphosphate-sugar epimerase
MATTCLITGATGFVGSHLAEACSARGYSVRALVRPGSTSSSLEEAGVAFVRGDLQEPHCLPGALDGVDVVFHCAAKVGDWGPADDYRRINVEGLRNLLEASRSKPLRRFVHLSSLGVYAARHHYGTDESEALPKHHVDGYTQSKVESEQLALTYQNEHSVPIVVLRPGFIYGPRDRTVVPKLVENLRNGIVRYLGSGRQALNTIFIGNLVDALLLAEQKEGVLGQVYNLTDDEPVSKRRFIEGIATGLGVPPPRSSVPLWVARLAAAVMETWARRRGDAVPPRLTQARLKFLGLNLDFSIEKAKRELGYRPRWTFDQALAVTVAWYRGRSDGRLTSPVAENRVIANVEG